MLFGARLRVARLPRRRAERARHVRLRRRLRPVRATRSPTAPTPSRGCASSPGSPARSRTVGAVLPRLHPVGAADGSAAGDDGRGRSPSDRTTSADHVGAQAHSGSTTSSAGATWSSHQEDPGRLRVILRQLRSQTAGGTRRDRRCPSVQPAGRCSAPVRRGTSPGSSIPSTTTRSGRRCSCTTRWTAPQIPVLLLTGWQDLFIEQTLAQYRTAARAAACPSALTIGSWTHSDMMTKGAPTVLRESLAWLDTHLGGRPQRRSAARCASTSTTAAGSTSTTGRPRCPSRCGTCNRAAVSATRCHPTRARPSTFTYDPANPTPTVGGRMLSPEGGYRDDSRLAERADVLSFTGDPLPAGPLRRREPGRRTVALAATTRTTTCSSGSARSTPRDARATSATDIVAAPTDSARFASNSTRSRIGFRAGSRIRVLVAGGSHPRFVRNLGTDEPLATGTRLVPATHTVHLGDGGVATGAARGYGLPSAD